LHSTATGCVTSKGEPGRDFGAELAPLHFVGFIDYINSGSANPIFRSIEVKAAGPRCTYKIFLKKIQETIEAGR